MKGGLNNENMVDREMDEWWGGGWNDNFRMEGTADNEGLRGRTVLDLPRGDADVAQMELTWTEGGTTNERRTCCSAFQRKQRKQRLQGG